MKYSQIGAVAFTLFVVTFVHVAQAAPKATKEELNAVSLRLERLERALDSQAETSANKEGLISLQRRLKAMEAELQKLRGENESLRNELEQLQIRQRESMMAIDKRLQQRPDSDEVMQPNVAESKEPAAMKNKEPVPAEKMASKQEPVKRQPVVLNGDTQDSSETIDAYRNAFLLLKQRRHDESIAAFENFLATYPNSKYSANAQYWLAEANYVTKRYDRALEEFNTVINRYPTSSKVPDARLKIGYTQYELEQYDDSRVTLTRLRSQFPNSTVAGLAQERLERLEREGH